MLRKLEGVNVAGSKNRISSRATGVSGGPNRRKGENTRLELKSHYLIQGILQCHEKNYHVRLKKKKRKKGVVKGMSPYDVVRDSSLLSLGARKRTGGFGKHHLSVRKKKKGRQIREAATKDAVALLWRKYHGQ